jgi:glycosyltransferase involved in cell wall biosynthesis
MKILHVVADDISGGAARGAYWLHKGLQAIGLDSTILIQSGSPDDESIIPANNQDYKKVLSVLRLAADQLPLLYYRNREKSIFSPGLMGMKLTSHPAWSEADIIHFHWINKAYFSWRFFPSITKPAIWTFRDMWPVTGGCHYTRSCLNYLDTCGNCPQLGSTVRHDLSFFLKKWKRSSYKKSNIYPVAISNWLADCARKSKMFDSDIHVIGNCIDTNAFRPIPKEISRQLLNLPKDKFIILGGARALSIDRRKGGQYLANIFNQLDPNKYHGVLFGRSHEDAFKIQVTMLGHLYDIPSLALAYSAADVFVTPAEQEAFGKTTIESMACGTPVIAFKNTGAMDIINHKSDGYLANPSDTDDLMRGIKWILQDSAHYQKLSTAARLKVKTQFSLSHIARKYHQLYMLVMNNESVTTREHA